MEIDIEIAYTRDRRSKDFKIESDFALETEETDEWDYDHGSPRKYIYGLGNVDGGAHKVKIRTINGNVYLKRGR